MYTSIEKDALRQGDIISNTQLLGAINLKEISYINDYNNKKFVGNIIYLLILDMQWYCHILVKLLLKMVLNLQA
jgi:hypothetical protein